MAVAGDVEWLWELCAHRELERSCRSSQIRGEKRQEPSLHRLGALERAAPFLWAVSRSCGALCPGSSLLTQGCDPNPGTEGGEGIAGEEAALEVALDEHKGCRSLGVGHCRARQPDG